MRADRLISLIMLLQTNGFMRAKDLAEKLEVSIRTIYRDMEALIVLGIPFQSYKGPEGGFMLDEGYKTNLNGFTRYDLMTLLMLQFPDKIFPDEVGKQIVEVNRKVLSKYKQNGGLRSNTISRIMIEWGTTVTANHTFLNRLYHAVIESISCEVQYHVSSNPSATYQRIFDPYGLVYKEDQWYLVGLSKKRICVIALHHIDSIEETGEIFTYPEQFSLSGYFQLWWRDNQEDKTGYLVRMLVPRSLKETIQERIVQSKVPWMKNALDLSKEPWEEITITFESLESARAKIIIFGGAIQVIEPLALRYCVLDYAKQILERYEV